MQYEDRLRRLSRHASGRMPRTILDVGAGYGDFLRFMHRRGWNTQGLEPARHAYLHIRDKKKLGIRHGGVEALGKMGLTKASVVTVNNVLEHVRDPRFVLEMIRSRFLTRNGVLCVIVPNDFSVLQDVLMKSVLKDKLSKQHYWVTPLEHLNYWSCGLMKRFLIKCGYRILGLSGDFPMEIFPIMGEDYLSHPETGKAAHLKRISFEKHLSLTGHDGLKDRLAESLAKLGIGRNIQIFATPRA
jgi:SAM-dependent methyltransferase